MTDIKKFSVQDVSVIALLDADRAPMIGDDGQPMTITVYGPGSKRYARAEAAASNRLLEQMKKRGNNSVEDEGRTEHNALFLTAVTSSFSANIEYNGLQGEELFKAVYADQSIGFIAEQVQKHVADWANFTKASPGS